jgi:hypothetical protein
MDGKLIVVSTVPGRNRGGVTLKSGANIYEGDKFTLPQLKDLVSDPAVSVVRGELVTIDEVNTLIAAAAKTKGAKA